MTYGDRYLELCREYVEYIIGYISTLRVNNSLKVNVDLLDKLSEESKVKGNILLEFVIYMKGNGRKITYQYDSLNSK